jgi:hypothetical protein
MSNMNTAEHPRTLTGGHPAVSVEALEAARDRLRAEHCPYYNQRHHHHCDCDWCRYITANPQDVAFTAEHGYTPSEAAEMSYVGKLMDACDTEEEANAVMDFFAG